MYEHPSTADRLSFIKISTRKARNNDESPSPNYVKVMLTTDE